MWERFTEKAKKVIIVAQEEATRLGHNYVGSEHLLLGIIKEKENIAARTLVSLGVNLEALKRALEKEVPRSPRPFPGVKQFTPRIKSILELAFDEARAWGSSYIGSEHLLLGLLREGKGVVARLLKRAGISLEGTRQQVSFLLGEEPGSSSSRKVKSSTPFLDEFSRDLTFLAKEGKLDPVIGREEEIERIVQVLSKRTKNNPVLVGEPGVGKTAIVEGLAQRIASGDIPRILRRKRVVAFDLALLVAGTKYRGEFEERLKRLTTEVQKTKGEIILFVDEVHTLVGTGGAEGALDASSILKPALARGELQCIGATTLSDYRKYMERDAALERRFQPIFIEEPTVEETVKILKGLRERYEAYHHVKILDQSLSLAVRLSDRYITDRYLPDKAVDIVDEASSRVHLRFSPFPQDLKEIEGKVDQVTEEKEKAVAEQKYEEATLLRDKELNLREKLRKYLEEEEKEKKEQVLVTPGDVSQIVSAWTGIPLTKVAEEETNKLLRMESALHQRIVGQEAAIKAVTRAIRRARAGLGDPKRPSGSFVFLGPTGVGKTELARALAEFLFDDEEALIRLDMSEYMEKFTVSRLIGAPPGYVGYEEGGQLTEAVRQSPYCVVLFDEIEKAHPDIFNILLQVMEEGQLTDALGHKVNFKNVVIIMTSNVGARLISEETQLGFRKSRENEEAAEAGSRSYEKMKNRVTEELKKTFKPEFLNRVDEVIVFHSLTSEELKQIVDLMLERVGKQVKEQEIELEVSAKVRGLLAKEGHSSTLGARPLRRLIQKLIEDPLSEEVLKGSFKQGDKVVARLEGGKIKFKKEEVLVREEVEPRMNTNKHK